MKQEVTHDETGSNTWNPEVTWGNNMMKREVTHDEQEVTHDETGSNTWWKEKWHMMKPEVTQHDIKASKKDNTLIFCAAEWGLKDWIKWTLISHGWRTAAEGSVVTGIMAYLETSWFHQNRKIKILWNSLYVFFRMKKMQAGEQAKPLYIGGPPTNSSSWLVESEKFSSRRQSLCELPPFSTGASRSRRVLEAWMSLAAFSTGRVLDALRLWSGCDVGPATTPLQTLTVIKVQCLC